MKKIIPNPSHPNTIPAIILVVFLAVSVPMNTFYSRCDARLGLVPQKAESDTKFSVHVFYRRTWFQGAGMRNGGAEEARMHYGISHSQVQLGAGSKTIWGASHMKTFHGWGQKERSRFPSMGSQPPLVKAFPMGTPHSFGRPLHRGWVVFLKLPGNGINRETPGGEARSMGHMMSGCTCEKLAGVDPELVTPALARLRDTWGQLDLNRCSIQSLWCTCNFILTFPTEHYTSSILINSSHNFNGCWLIFQVDGKRYILNITDL